MHNHNSLFITRIITTPQEHQGWIPENVLDTHILRPRKQNFLVFTFVPFSSMLQTLFSMMSCNIIDEKFYFLFNMLLATTSVFYFVKL